MGLFKKMKDTVRGSAKVAYSSVLPGLSSSHLRLVITADGVSPTPVEVKTPRHAGRWPKEGDTIPVTVDRANPQTFKIEWSEVRRVRDTLRQDEERATQDALAEARGEAPSTSREEPEPMAREEEDSAEEMKQEARQIWRQSLERGRCTQGEFEKQMQDLDGPKWREREPADFLAKHGLRH